jgi:hypothetical protein
MHWPARWMRKDMRKISEYVSYLALVDQKKESDRPTATELSEHLKFDALICPSGGPYGFGTAETVPRPAQFTVA